ncbi:D-alanyl-D-alanine carboxypeptidase family protein [Sphingomonas morindae]|uniref:D-alanyl-D-alanine carboxypeptidase n=1 Tax=Sphingomonas morindae TaxID=1541170 RepID=A0ABY4X4Z9_9SPHN|nr:D-alanyl-D-alanine carboxypeptidase family protein [Sphingomonas morindae]USI71968.1 D-alanyl-D-alanine carboxypeptidase [Sphingomonas morindae]
MMRAVTGVGHAGRVGLPRSNRFSSAARAALLMPLLALAALLLGTGAARAAPRYAAFMIDANSREVLYSNAADEPRHPASLTKMMTLYLTFDALEAGRLRLTDAVPVSRLAAAQQPSRLGLAVGQSLSVDNAISVVAVKSANDIAVALAERIGGSVPRFVAMMNAKARELGMRNTHYANPSGLTDSTNITTARDLAILGLALIQRHPRYYRYFGQRDFQWQRAMLINHNHLLGHMVGMDGIKTGYTVDSGFTLAASAVRGDRRLIAIVLGEPSLAARNRDVTALIEAGFSVLDRRALGQSVTVASVLPTLSHPALRIEPVIEQGSSDEPNPPRPRRATRAGPVHHAAARPGHARSATHLRHGAGKASARSGAHGKAKPASRGKTGTKAKSGAKAKGGIKGKGTAAHTTHAKHHR